MLIVLVLTQLLVLFSKSQCSSDYFLLRSLAAIHPQLDLHTLVAPEDVLHTAVRGRIVRQVNFNTLKMENFLHCSKVVTRHQCETGYVQGRLGVVLKCRNESLARLGAEGCATNHNGEYCASASMSLLSSAAELMNGESACLSSAVSCSTECRNFLLSLKNTLGCCFNSLVNTTDNPASASLGPISSPPLWQRCNVVIPSKCTDGLTLPQTPSNAQTCSTHQLSRKLAEYDCTGYNMQPVVEALLRDGRCGSLVKTTVKGCGINSNGQYCSEIVNNDALSALSSASDTSFVANNVLVTLATNCDSVGTTSCSSSCQQSVQKANLDYSCCLDIYNQSMRAIGVNYPSLSYEVWKSCGVDPQGTCESTLSVVKREDEFAWLTSLLSNSL